ncbi:MAG TPA: FAD-dependent monooxygenase [Beijerinckiaceae bacterium]|nr:FAD-dependent monooxygenase [Beijerinckiaceae bacterium]
MASQRHAVIAGAGIGGLTAALTLARAGWTVDVFEQAHKLEPVGAGVQLGPNATRILYDLGLEAALAETAVATEQLIVRTGLDGRRRNGMRHTGEAVRRWNAPFLVIHRGDLQMTLLAAASATPGVTIMLGQRLEDISERTGRTMASFSKYGEVTEIDADLIVGADGVWSKARSHVGLTGPTNFSGSVAWRTVVPAEAVPEAMRARNTNLWLGPGAHVVHYPVQSGRTINIVAVVDDGWRERGWSESGDISWINRRFIDWHKDLRTLIGSAEHWLRWSLFDRPPEPKWSRGIITLLGDAAHPMLPFLAQGAAQAIEDAAALAAALADTPDVAAALRNYERRRIPRTARVQKLSHRQRRIYHASGPLATARDIAMGLMGEKGLADRFDWLYREDP